MRAVRLSEYGKPFELVNIGIPDPGPREVLIEVAACGVCGSDRFLQKGGFGSALPIVPGHEASGTVVALGRSTTGLRVGQRVALYYIDHCGTCGFCRAGRENICVRARRMGVDFDGAMAEYVRIAANCCIPIDDDIDFAAAAVITDALGTPMHALAMARLKPGQTVMVVGVGGVGANAIQIAKAMGLFVIAASRSPEARALAERLGADKVVESDPAGQSMRDAVGGKGVDAVIQCAPVAAAYRAAISCLAIGGKLVVVGTTEGTLEIDLNRVLRNEHQIIGSRGFTRADIRKVLEWHGAGKLAVGHLLNWQRPLDEINEAIADLDNPKVVRTVLRP